ncbi:rho GTPase-activating protein 4-like isoform X2 [Chrysemys picta bellii]|uniref:rho GTPase-activating protein 4-like isoform X2 n=1 Tax=Chrysemys picta bellii TaxID=8478 RepID=UPI0032B1079E
MWPQAGPLLPTLGSLPPISGSAAARGERGTWGGRQRGAVPAPAPGRDPGGCPPRGDRSLNPIPCPQSQPWGAGAHGARRLPHFPPHTPSSAAAQEMKVPSKQIDAPGLLGPFPFPAPPARTPGSLPCSSLPHPHQPQTPGSLSCSSLPHPRQPRFLGPFPAPLCPTPGLLGSFPAPLCPTPASPGLLGPFPAPLCTTPASPKLLGPFPAPLCPTPASPGLLGPFPAHWGSWAPPADAAPPAELRGQLGEQQRGREAQAELRLQLLQDMGDFLRRKAELEQEYSRGLEKLSERFTARLRGAKEHSRREQDPPSPLQCWQLVLNQTRQAGRDHGALSDIYAGPLTLHLTQLSDDLGRLVKKSRDLEQQMQEELLTMISELQMAMKTYQTQHAESQSAENKLREAERQEEKRGGRQPPEPGGAGQDKLARRASLRKGERLVEKRQARFLAAQSKCTGARNDYLLHLGSTNAVLRNYYLRDVSDILDCSDLGFHLSLGRLLRTYLAAEGRAQSSWGEGLGALEGAVLALDPPGDKARLMEANPAAYCPPPRFEYHPHEGDEVSEVQAVGSLRPELLLQWQAIETRLKDLSLETEEVNKTLQATLSSFRELLGAEEPEVLEAFGGPGSAESLRGASAEGRGGAKRRAQQLETETFYLTKLELFLTRRSIGAKLQSKLETLGEAIAKAAAEDGEELRALPRASLPRVPAAFASFPTDLEDFVQKSGQAVPLVVESCIRFITLHGLQHEGIFRVPGSQMRVTEIREAFERGEDPLAGGSYPRDLDSVAGLLKSFFRGLQKPLIPPDVFPELLVTAQLESPSERISHLRTLLARLPAPVVVVLRYLFAFLNHVSQHSEENMMNPYNLAVCFGPTLAAAPPGLDPVSTQPHANEAVKCLILYPEATFPPPDQLPGPLYERCLAPPDEDGETLPPDPAAEESEGDGPPETSTVASEDDPQGPPEAVARFSYEGRSSQELSFQPGDRIRLLAKASPDWWRGELGGARGLVPHKYISLIPSTEKSRSRRTSGSDGDAGSPPAEPTPESISRLRVNSEGSRGRQRPGTSPIRKLASPFIDSGRLPFPLQPPSAPRAVDRTERGALGVGLSGREKQGAPEKHVEMDKAVTRNMDSVFKELLNKSGGRRGGADSIPEPRETLGPPKAPWPPQTCLWSA